MTHKKKRPNKAQKPQRQGDKPHLSGPLRFMKKIKPVLFIAAALVLVAAAVWYFGQYRPLYRTVIRVNDTEITMLHFIQMLKREEEGQSRFDGVIRDLEHNELIRQGTARLGVIVSDDEVIQEIKRVKHPDNDVQREIVRTQLLTIKMRDEYFEAQNPPNAPQVHIITMLLESKDRAIEARERVARGESFGDLAKQLSLAGYGNDLGWHVKEYLVSLLRSSVPVEYAFKAGAGSVSQPINDETVTKNVGYWLIKVLEGNRERQSVRVYAMLLGSEEEAQGIKVRLERGEDFAALAREFSRWRGARENGGDMGVLTAGGQSEAFDKVVFDTKTAPGTVNGPVPDKTIATKGGYWLVQVLGKEEDRQIEKSDRDFLKNQALDRWLSSLFEGPNNRIEVYLDDDAKAWALKRATGK